MKWGFGFNSHVEMNYEQSLCSQYQVMRIQFDCSDNLWWEFSEFSSLALELNQLLI